MRVGRAAGPARSWLLGSALALAAFGACRREREREPGDGVHPAGFALEESASFHGLALARDGYPLGACRACHGDQYEGGRVGSTCVGSGCHTEGVEACSTCHEAEPTSGAHGAHALACDACHGMREDARSPFHPDGAVQVSFPAVARAGASVPSYSPETGRCNDVYCHGGGTLSWREPLTLDCGGCHANPPATHAQFAAPDEACERCHGGEGVHLDGKLDVLPLACDACHGAGPLGAPPPAIDGSMGAASVGAHARHLDPTLADRVGKVARCDDCHVVPKGVDDVGHVDAAAPADVRLRLGGAYDEASRRCVSTCHFDASPGPAWDDTSGAARACDACHGVPPERTREGITHPPSAPEQCTLCHLVGPTTHVDGRVDFTW